MLITYHCPTCKAANLIDPDGPRSRECAYCGSQFTVGAMPAPAGAGPLPVPAQPIKQRSGCWWICVIGLGILFGAVLVFAMFTPPAPPASTSTPATPSRR